MSSTRTLAGTLTDSAGVTVALVPSQVTVYDTPTLKTTGLPLNPVTKGTVVTGKVVSTVDAALTVKSLTLTLDGVAIAVAVDGSFSFTA